MAEGGGAAIVDDDGDETGVALDAGAQIVVEPGGGLLGRGAEAREGHAHGRRRGEGDADDALGLGQGEFGNDLAHHAGDLGEDLVDHGEAVIDSPLGHGLAAQREEQHFGMGPVEVDADGVGALGIEPIGRRRLAPPPAQHRAALHQAPGFEIGQDARRGLRTKAREAGDVGIGGAGMPATRVMTARSLAARTPD